jgi:hypothetical protein
MHTINKIFTHHDPAKHSRPWIARVGTWPDSGPAVLVFGKLVKAPKGSNAHPVGTVEADVGDVVRWGWKALSTGLADPAGEGWAIVGPGGILGVVDKDEARAARRRLHPEDANAAPTGFPGKVRKGKRPFTPRAAAPPALTSAQAAHYAALIEVAKAIVVEWHGTSFKLAPKGLAPLMATLTELMAGVDQSNADAALAQATTPEAPPEPEPEEPEEETPEEPVVPEPMATDKDGLPLF